MAPVQQQCLFAEEEMAPKKRIERDANLVRNGLKFMLDLMRKASDWPWSEDQVRWFRESYWPEAYAALPEREAARFRAQIEAESARLDASGNRA